MLKNNLGGGGGGSWRVVCSLCFFGGLYIVRFMMMMVCTYEIYGNGEKKRIVNFTLCESTGIGFEQRTLRS